MPPSLLHLPQAPPVPRLEVAPLVLPPIPPPCGQVAPAPSAAPPLPPLPTAALEALLAQQAAGLRSQLALLGLLQALVAQRGGA